MAEGLACYREEKFSLTHEHWEAVWLASEEPEKTFLQALIQITAAFRHLQRGNALGASSLLTAALRRLEPFPPVFEGVSVIPLRESINVWLGVLGTVAPPIGLLVPNI